MSKYGFLFVGFCLIFSLVSCGKTTPASRSAANGSEQSDKFAVIEDGRVTHIQTKGSLASTYFVPCVGIEGVKNVFTPADLYPASARCLQAKQYKRAIELYSLAGAYAAFDGERIADDKVGGAANTVLIMRHVRPVIQSSDEVRDGFVAAMEALSAETGSYCDAVKKIGKPNYHPEYMIRHSLQYLRSNAESYDLLKSNFDADGTWSHILANFFHCP